MSTRPLERLFLNSKESANLARAEALLCPYPANAFAAAPIPDVYGNFTEHLVSRLGPEGHLNVIDVAPIQITNLHAKLKPSHQVTLPRQDSSDLQFDEASQDATVVFFLLHEQPLEVRLKTIAEAWRVTRPGGRMVFIDYHRPLALNPFRYLMVLILTTLEPFAMDLWRTPIADWLPSGAKLARVDKKTYFGGLYQKVVLQR